MTADAGASTASSVSSIASTTMGASTTRRGRFDERQGGAAAGQEGMNAEQLQQNVGQYLRLRPHPLLARYVSRTIAVMASSSGDPMTARRLVKTDYLWRLVSVEGGVLLHCHHTNHDVILGNDNVREFRTPGFLMLECQLTLDGDKVYIEPIA